MDTRTSPIGPLVEGASATIKDALGHPTHLLKLGVKGPGLILWAQQHSIALPTELYDTLPVGKDGILARVGSDELILECSAEEPLWHQFQTGQGAENSGIYPIEQQSATLVLSGKTALPTLAQTCGVDFACQALERIVYTRVAGASCAVVPRSENDQTVYRLWIDYTLAPYLWQTLAEIIGQLEG